MTEILNPLHPKACVITRVDKLLNDLTWSRSERAYRLKEHKCGNYLHSLIIQSLKDVRAVNTSTTFIPNNKQSSDPIKYNDTLVFDGEEEYRICIEIDDAVNALTMTYPHYHSIKIPDEVLDIFNEWLAILRDAATVKLLVPLSTSSLFELRKINHVNRIS